MFYKGPDKFENKNEEGENPFLISFSDLMAALLVIFILSLIIMMIQLQRERDKVRLDKDKILSSIQELEKIQKDILKSMKHISFRENTLTQALHEIKSDLEKKDIHIEVSQNIIRIPEESLKFELGKYDIPESSNTIAFEIGNSLLNTLKKEKNLKILDTVFIEGHTDAVKNFKEMGNWKLSAERAISLWLFWTKKPGEFTKLSNLKNSKNKPLISVSGYAETRPIIFVEKDNLEEPRNRRIDLRFTILNSEKEAQKVYKKVNDLINQTKKIKEEILK